MTSRSKYRLYLVLQFVALASILKAIESMYGHAYAGQAPAIFELVWLFGSVIVGLAAGVAVTSYRSKAKQTEYDQQKVATETLSKLAKGQPKTRSLGSQDKNGQ